MKIHDEIKRLWTKQFPKSSFNDIEASVFAFCLFLLTPPFFLWNSIPPLYFIFICNILAIRNINRDNPKSFVFFFAFLLLYIFFAIKNEFNIFGLLTFLGISTLSLISYDFLKNVFNKYIFIFSISFIPSIIVYVLINIFGINLPNTFIDPLNPLRSSDYSCYPFLVQENAFEVFILPRFYGYYDEPGVVGTVSGVILMCSGFNLKKWVNIPIFIAGVMSFSLAFLIITFVYGFLFVSTKFKIIIAVVTIGVIMMFSENELLKGYFLNRLEYDDGQFVGDNRTVDDFSTYYTQFSNSSDYYFGIGQNSSQDINFGGASYKDLILSYGIIAFIAYVMLFIFMAYFQFKISKEFFLYLFVLFSVLYQRPFIGSFFYVFLLFAPLAFLLKESNEPEVNSIETKTI